MTKAFGNHSDRCRYTTLIHHPIFKSVVLSDFDAIALSELQAPPSATQTLGN